MTAALRSACRHYLYVLALSSAIAVFTTLVWPRHSYLSQWIYATCIGTVCWITIEFGRYAVPARHCHGDAEGSHGWPKSWRGLLLVVMGILVGFYGGDWLAALLLGSAAHGRSADGRDTAVGLYITIAAGGAASFYFHARGKAAALAAAIAAAERDATQARLQLLASQLEPHMLFNTLANLRVLIALDPARATRMLDHLVAFLRATLQASRTTEHGLAQEFARLRDYLELMSVRMGERLRYTLELPEELADLPIPALLLQPLVENAIQHGLEPQVAGGTIHVRAWRHDDRLWLEVQDDGAGLPDTSEHPPRGTGFGLDQIQRRLAARHGDLAAVQLARAPDGGTVARVRLPATAPPALPPQPTESAAGRWPEQLHTK